MFLKRSHWHCTKVKGTSLFHLLACLPRLELSVTGNAQPQLIFCHVGDAFDHSTSDIIISAVRDSLPSASCRQTTHLTPSPSLCHARGLALVQPARARMIKWCRNMSSFMSWMSMPVTCLSLKDSLSNSSQDAVSLVNSTASSFGIRPAALDHARGSNTKTSRLQAFRTSPSPPLPKMSTALPV